MSKIGRSYRVRQRFSQEGLDLFSPRTELSEPAENPAVWRELDLWLIWAGISQDAKQPVSRIGIYTDFT